MSNYTVSQHTIFDPSSGPVEVWRVTTSDTVVQLATCDDDMDLFEGDWNSFAVTCNLRTGDWWVYDRSSKEELAAGSSCGYHESIFEAFDWMMHQHSQHVQ